MWQKSKKNLLQYLWSTQVGIFPNPVKEIHSTEVKESDSKKLQRWGIFQAIY